MSAQVNRVFEAMTEDVSADRLFAHSEAAVTRREAKKLYNGNSVFHSPS